MRLDNAVYLAALLGSNVARGATVPSDPWKSLTPSKTLSGATTNFDGSFAISLQTVGTVYGSGNASVPGGGSASTTADPENGKLRARGAVSQISDGQLQGNSAPVSTLDTESVAAASSPASVVNQITDGQIQQQSAAPTSAAAASVVNQITDGQIQQQSAAPTSAAAASVVNQITDGQIQQQSAAPTSAAAASVVNQITDGQIQQQSAAPTSAAAASVVNQIGDGQIQKQSAAAESAPASVVNQIGDGQIQKQSAAAESAPASVVNQITDGQIQHQTTAATSASVAAQITDGQVQKQSLAAESVTPSAAAPSKPAASQEGDGQIQGNNSTSSSSSGSDSDSEYPETRVSKDALAVTLHDGILRDSKGRIGSIVANRQFQFDGPPPQAGAIYAAGWSIKDDSLALGDSSTFFQCKSGDFYNIYDQTIGAQCSEVKIKVLKIVN